MKIKCSSCGLEHESSDYPDAFEIPCACGYSILKPDENYSADDVPNFNSTPLSLESQDDAVKISVADDETNLQAVEPENSLALHMTPPQDLPSEMPYDPSEILIDPTTTPAEASSQGESEFSNTSDAALVAPVTYEGQDADTPTPSPETSEANPIDPVREQFSFSEQPLFNLLIQNADSQFCLLVKEKLRWLSLGRPWLHPYKENIEGLLDPDQDLHLQNVPELIAVELYISALEKNKTCEFEPASS